MSDGGGEEALRVAEARSNQSFDQPHPLTTAQSPDLHHGPHAPSADVDLDGETSSDSESESSTSSSIRSFMLAPTPANTMIPDDTHTDTSVTWNETTFEVDTIGVESTSEAAAPSATKRLPVPTFHSSPSDGLDDIATLPQSRLPVPPPPLISHRSSTTSSHPVTSSTALRTFPSTSGVGIDSGTTGLDSSGTSSVNLLGSSTSTQGSRIALLGFKRHRGHSTPPSTSSGFAPRGTIVTKPNKYLAWLGLGSTVTQDREDATRGADTEASVGTHSATHSMHTIGGGPMSAAEIQMERDRKRLEQLGYSEVLGRDYGFWACFSVAFCNIGFLQGTLLGILGTFTYGGPRMILSMWPVSAVIMVIITLSMAELASAFPVAGAMASWAWKCARGGVRGERYWGWAINGITMGFHIAVMSLITDQISDLLVNTLELGLQSYTPESWHSLVMYLGFVLIFACIGSSTWGRNPKFWTGGAIYLVSVWLILCISLLATTAHRHGATSTLSAPYSNRTGYSSKALVYMLGWVLTSVATGVDAAAHISEETRNPSRNVPLAMMAAVTATYVLGYVGILILLLAIDVHTLAVFEKQPFPVGAILQHSLGRSGAVGISSLMIIAFILQAVAQLQASSRFVFAIARDQALPYSDFLKQTSRRRMPLHATWLVSFLTVPLAFGLWRAADLSSTVLSLGGGTLCLLSYVIPIFLYLLSKIDLQTEGRTSWSLRRWSKPVGLASCLFGCLVVIMMAFPINVPVTPETISWSPVVVVGTLVLCFLTWKLFGEKNYSGPVRALTRWEAGAEIDLQTTLRTTNRSMSKHNRDILDTSKAFGGDASMMPIVRTETAATSPPTTEDSLTPTPSEGSNYNRNRPPGEIAP